MGHTETMAEGDEQYQMETTESGASDTHMVEAGQIRKGGYIMVKGKACEMKEDLQLPNVDYKTDDDNKISEQIKSIIEEIDGGAEIELYCTVMQAIGKEKVVEIKKKDA